MVLEAPLALQKAIGTILASDTTLQGMNCGVWADRDQHTFPYIRIGDHTSINRDTFKEEHRELTYILHIYSQQEGDEEALLILGRMNELLNKQSFAVTDWGLVGCMYETHVTLMDDEFTRHIPVKYRIHVER